MREMHGQVIFSVEFLLGSSHRICSQRLCLPGHLEVRGARSLGLVPWLRPVQQCKAGGLQADSAGEREAGAKDRDRHLEEAAVLKLPKYHNGLHKLERGGEGKGDRHKDLHRHPLRTPHIQVEIHQPQQADGAHHCGPLWLLYEAPRQPFWRGDEADLGVEDLLQAIGQPSCHWQGKDVDPLELLAQPLAAQLFQVLHQEESRKDHGAHRQVARNLRMEEGTFDCGCFARTGAEDQAQRSAERAADHAQNLPALHMFVEDEVPNGCDHHQSEARDSGAHHLWDQRVGNHIGHSR
mmetsp:Transcript_68400/g.189299  ORF Transcript_68400/g.189299 Transcript_68400/m.189299 type:complete len:294 (-) Transcript_68400:283-1164(-)